MSWGEFHNLVGTKDNFFKQVAWQWEVEISEQEHRKAMELLKKDHAKEAADLEAKVR